MKRLRLLGPVGIALVLLAPFLVQIIDRRSTMLVVSVPIGTRIVRDSVIASGNLIYEREAQLSPELIGRVTDVLVAEGDHVAKGQVIVRIDEQPFRAVVDQQQAALLVQSRVVDRLQLVKKQAKLRFDRGQVLLEKGFLSKDSAEQMTLDLRVAQSDVRQNVLEVARARAVLSQADQQAKRTIIRAPMTGSVIAVGIKPGETAVPSATGIPGSSLVTIADLNSIVADLNVDESDIARLRQKQVAAIFCPPLPTTSLKGTIQTIALALRPGGIGQRDAGARNYSVKVGFTDTRLAGLRPGMECRATIYTEPAISRIAVPVQAIQSNRADDADGYSAPSRTDAKTKPFLYVEQGGVVHKRFVTLGIADSSYQQVLSGLSQGERVVTGPYRALLTLVDGQHIRRADVDKTVAQ